MVGEGILEELPPPEEGEVGEEGEAGVEVAVVGVVEVEAAVGRERVVKVKSAVVASRVLAPLDLALKW